MSERTHQTIYFEKPGKANTPRVMDIVSRYAQESGIRTVVVATTTGETGAIAARVLSGHNVVLVTHSTGYQGPDGQELTDGNRTAIEAAGGVILTATHAFGGVGRAVRRKLSTYQVDEVIAYTLRTLGEGMKVTLEITVMAADAGLIRCDEEIIAVGGTGRGADTAAVIKPAHAQDFFDVRVLEILCKPRLGSK